MAQQISIDATVTAGPQVACDSGFPSGNTQIAFRLNPDPKQIARKTGDVSFPLASPSAPFALPEIGASSLITQCTTFFFRCMAPMTLVLTFNNPGGADIVATIPVNGSFLHEADLTRYMKSATVQGVGDIEYFAAGLL